MSKTLTQRQRRYMYAVDNIEVARYPHALNAVDKADEPALAELT